MNFWQRIFGRKPEPDFVPAYHAPALDIPRHLVVDEVVDTQRPTARRGSPRQSPPGSGWQPIPATVSGALLGPGVDRRRRLDYPEAAQSFLSWLQEQGETGEIARPRLANLYAEHCEAEGLAIVPENFLLQALARHVTKFERRVPRRDGRRQRVTTYDIPRQSVTAPGPSPEAHLNRRAA